MGPSNSVYKEVFDHSFQSFPSLNISIDLVRRDTAPKFLTGPPTSPSTRHSQSFRVVLWKMQDSKAQARVPQRRESKLQNPWICGLKWLFMNRRKDMDKKALSWSCAPSCKHLWREASVIARWSVTSESPKEEQWPGLQDEQEHLRALTEHFLPQVYYPSPSSTETMDMAIPSPAWRTGDTFS